MGSRLGSSRALALNQALLANSCSSPSAPHQDRLRTPSQVANYRPALRDKLCRTVCMFVVSLSRMGWPSLVASDGQNNGRAFAFVLAFAFQRLRSGPLAGPATLKPPVLTVDTYRPTSGPPFGISGPDTTIVSSLLVTNSLPLVLGILLRTQPHKLSSTECGRWRLDASNDAAPK